MNAWDQKHCSMQLAVSPGVLMQCIILLKLNWDSHLQKYVDMMIENKLNHKKYANLAGAWHLFWKSQEEAEMHHQIFGNVMLFLLLSTYRVL